MTGLAVLPTHAARPPVTPAEKLHPLLLVGIAQPPCSSSGVPDLDRIDDIETTLMLEALRIELGMQHVRGMDSALGKADSSTIDFADGAG